MSGEVRVSDLLLENPPRALYSRLASAPSLSKKAWTDAYHPISNPTVHLATLNGVNGFLALDQYQADSIYSTDGSDIDRLDKSAYRLNYLDRVDIQTEGDVERDFYQNFALPVSLAWQKEGHFLQRSLSGPPGPTNSNKTVDHLYSWQVGGRGGNERCQVIGEMKQWGVVIVDEWYGVKEKKDITTRLGKEIRAYASEYKCPQVFVYDGIHLLIVQFKAKDANQIKSADCPVDCCILARAPEDAQQCAARYALYRLVWRGWIRMTGEWSVEIPVSLDGWDRKFRFWSGRPYWEQGRIKEMIHPNGYQRRFDGVAWHWVDANEQDVKDANGVIIWDSLQSWP
ncbi:hypothetical protein SS1G_08066 [Sclerotinia sclerotiorum 1980 UF-70]|uniref:Uncharacterized protein n=2 Tax=Sclerotinia sclerotiorum (strain ATCC 18683 / 1980 / Ss-1) TaxID=665079 RepID=A7ERW1_SCLS1|nr:hypothetical protein SS1G_08066 [Sclerotinia sclerotiorum 1980 UF-70]APA13349.1 hypothetical protein sscle_11g081190 [Sclerotinia sclerotiorum 1980 UF-70]EDN92203.1 hypothetical protein SS1G_08066 [Sclerotinia sclerotiorum 1980 UF-70]